MSGQSWPPQNQTKCITSHPRKLFGMGLPTREMWKEIAQRVKTIRKKSKKAQTAKAQKKLRTNDWDWETPFFVEGLSQCWGIKFKGSGGFILGGGLFLGANHIWCDWIGLCVDSFASCEKNHKNADNVKSKKMTLTGLEIRYGLVKYLPRQYNLSDSCIMHCPVSQDNFLPLYNILKYSTQGDIPHLWDLGISGCQGSPTMRAINSKNYTCPSILPHPPTGHLTTSVVLAETSGVTILVVQNHLATFRKMAAFPLLT